MSMDNIEHVVVLMLENRSFDMMLGWLYEKDQSVINNIPQAAANDKYRGLQGVNPDDFINMALDNALTARPSRGVRGFTVPDVDPGEEFEHVLTQFYNHAATLPDKPDMKGLLDDFVGVLQARGYGPADVIRLAQTCLSSFTPDQLPVLNQLARHYAVCDDWFASVPSQTNPNRAFLMSGTSNGMVNNGELETNPEARAIEGILKFALGDDRIDAPTIFNALSSGGIDWAVFWQTSYAPQKMHKLLTGLPILIPLLAVLPVPGAAEIAVAAAVLLLALRPYSAYLEDLTSGELGSCYTRRLFPQIQKIADADQHFHKIEEFHRRARAGQLPAFSYIEPFWSISHTTNDNPVAQKLVSVLGNDYHPPCNVLVGEQFVEDVYTSLISNRAAWSKTLLLITFDEFVGTFDHRTQELRQNAVAPPWGQNGQPPFRSPANFDFKRLGARVPTIVVSPYVQKNTVFRSDPAQTPVPYDHTSVIATTLKWRGLSDQLPQFGARAAAAPTFEQVLTLAQPRTDEADLPFLDTPHAPGDPVTYGASFVLKNQNGDYLSAFYPAMKATGVGALIPDSVLSICVDLDLAAYFPTTGGPQPATLSFVTQAADPPAQISNNSQVMVISREPGLGALNILGAWNDSHDCYYADEFFEGDNAPKQKWIIQKLASTDQPVRYGDQVYLVSVSSTGQRLTRDTRWWSSSGYITTGTGGDYWTIEPAPARVFGPPQPWNNAPRLSMVTACQQGGSRGAQLWGIDTDGQLRSTYQQSPGGPWSGWSDLGNGASPANLISITAAQQNDGTVRIWAVDASNVLHSSAQISPGGDWTGWSVFSMFGGGQASPPLRLVAATHLSVQFGAQLWGVDTSGTLRSAIQPLIGPWFPWLPPGSLMASTPDNAISVAPIQLSNGSEMIFMVDAGNVLYANAQTSSGDWNPCVTWSGAPPLRAVAAVKQGGSRGPQLWGIDTAGQLRSTYQQSPGGDWSDWSGGWNNSPGQLISVSAAPQNDGTARIWVVNTEGRVYSTAQTSPGGDWGSWTS
jgi:phospholipase C